MMIDKSSLGLLAIVFTLAGHIPYFFDILKGRTKPHVFSWFVWTLLLSIGLAAQVTEGAGPGLWATFGDALACLMTTILCIWYGTRDITRSDKISLVLALVGVLLWVLTSTPVWAVIFAVAADALGFFPTFRKAFKRPDQETPLTFLLIAIGYILALFSIESYSISTTLYPVYLLLANGTFWAYLLIRRYQLKTV